MKELILYAPRTWEDMDETFILVKDKYDKKYQRAYFSNFCHYHDRDWENGSNWQTGMSIKEFNKLPNFIPVKIVKKADYCIVVSPYSYPEPIQTIRFSTYTDFYQDKSIAIFNTTRIDGSVVDLRYPLYTFYVGSWIGKSFKIADCNVEKLPTEFFARVVENNKNIGLVTFEVTQIIKD